MFYSYQNTPIYYETIGTGTPVLLLHGLGGDSTLMKACMEPVFMEHAGYKRIYLDLPGMGNSKASDELASSDEILNLLCAFIRDMIKGRFLLAGESYGGYLAGGILSRHARDISGVLLLCPVVTAEHEKRTLPDSFLKFKDTQYLKQLDGSEKDNFGTYTVLLNAYTHKRYKQEILSGLNSIDRDFVRSLKKQNYPFGPDTAEAVQNLSFARPALLIAGRQDMCVGYRDIWNLLEHYPRASFAVLDTAGHNLQIEQPAVFHALVLNWLERVENNP